MADNYTESSFSYPFPEERKEEVEKVVYETSKKYMMEYENITEDEWDEEYDRCMPSDYEFGEGCIKFFHEESIDINLAADIVSALQVALEATETFTFSWCFTCSKPRIGEFGGGSVAITPNGKQYWVGSEQDATDATNRDGPYINAVWTVEDMRLAGDVTEEDIKVFIEHKDEIRKLVAAAGWKVILEEIRE